MFPRLLRAWPTHLLFLALAVAAVYHHTLDVPFYLDDFSSIRENSLIYKWQGFEALRQFGQMRVLAYLSFAANYHWNHFDPRGYHLVNIIIHFLVGVAVYGFARGLLRTPRLTEAISPSTRAALPLLAAALFVLHPLQTQAVTYIVQRLASLVALFYVAALAAFVQARLAETRRPRFLWAGGCLLFAVLALFTKENSATLPFAFLLLEAVFFPHRPKELRALAGLAAGGLALVWVVAAMAFGHTPFSVASLKGLTSHSLEISRAAYFATQMLVLWSYLRLFLWPSGLHLDYDEPLRRFSEPMVWLALAGHLLLMMLGLWAWRRWPLVTFAILFYYLAHGVESSIVPIPELAFEHRTYLPNLGLCLLASWALLLPSSRGLGSRLVPAGTALLLLVLGVATYRRNQLWLEPVAFWQDNVRLAPTKARAWGNLAKELIQASRPVEAEQALKVSLRLQGAATSGVVDPRDVVNLALALHAQHRDSAALMMIEEHIDRPMEPAVRATLHLNRGNIQIAQGRLAAAEASFREALALAPQNLAARANLASTWAQGGRLAAAESLFREVLEIDPGDAALRENLLQVRAARLIAEGQAYGRTHRPERALVAYRLALEALEEALRLNPSNAAVRATREEVRRLTRPPTR